MMIIEEPVEVNAAMTTNQNPAAGNYDMEVVSIRDHGVVCKVTGVVDGGFATLPKGLVESVLAVAGRALETGARLRLGLSAPVAQQHGDSVFGLTAPPSRLVSESASPMGHASGNGNLA
jgi:hypothetical protein